MTDAVSLIPAAPLQTGLAQLVDPAAEECGELYRAMVRGFTAQRVKSCIRICWYDKNDLCAAELSLSQAAQLIDSIYDALDGLPKGARCAFTLRLSLDVPLRNSSWSPAELQSVALALTQPLTDLAVSRAWSQAVGVS